MAAGRPLPAVRPERPRRDAAGAPQIIRYDATTKKARALTAAGYLQPSYSPDGRTSRPTRTSAPRHGRRDPRRRDRGREWLRVTDDGASWAPAWSPAGDGIAFLHIQGQTVDLRLAKLDGHGAPSWTVNRRST